MFIYWNDAKSVIIASIRISQAITFVILHFVVLTFLDNPSITTSTFLSCYFLIMPLIMVLFSIGIFNLVEIQRWMLRQNNLLQHFDNGFDFYEILRPNIEELIQQLRPFWILHLFVYRRIGLVELLGRVIFHQHDEPAVVFFKSAKNALCTPTNSVLETVILDKDDIECVSRDLFNKGEIVFVLNNHTQMPIKSKTLKAFVVNGRYKHHITNTPITTISARRVVFNEKRF